MTTVADVQRALMARGCDLAPYWDDGDIGPTTLGAKLKEGAVVAGPAPRPSIPALAVPGEWRSWAKMQRTRSRARRAKACAQIDGSLHRLTAVWSGVALPALSLGDRVVAPLGSGPRRLCCGVSDWFPLRIGFL